jgi:hypothetical protein
MSRRVVLIPLTPGRFRSTADAHTLPRQPYHPGTCRSCLDCGVVAEISRAQPSSGVDVLGAQRAGKASERAERRLAGRTRGAGVRACLATLVDAVLGVEGLPFAAGSWVEGDLS